MCCQNLAKKAVCKITKIATLVGMGFEEARAHSALFQCHFDVANAISYLLDQAVHTEDPAAGSRPVGAVPPDTQSVVPRRPGSLRAPPHMGAAGGAARGNAEEKATLEDRGEIRRRVRGPSESERFAVAHGEGAQQRYSDLNKPDSDSE